MNSNRAAGVIMLLGSLFFLCLGVYVTFFTHTGYEETTATITRIESTRHGNKRTHTDYVTYEVNGVTYEGILNVHQSNYREGKEIKIYYDPSDPSRLSGDSGSLGYFIMGISGFSGVFSLAMIFGKGRKGQYA